jgi:multidrug efflux pump subunit AcrA (membrane-fusion protein)
MASFKTFAQTAEKARLELEARQALQRAKRLKRIKTRTAQVKAELGRDLLENGFQEEPENPDQVGIGELSTDLWTPEELVEMAQPHEPLLVDWDMYSSPNPARWS